MHWLFLAVLFLPTLVLAECRDKNLYALETSPLNKIPVYDQDGSGTCYAYTASQLLNYHFLKNNLATELAVHPAWAAVNYAADVNNQSTWGGFVFEAIGALQKFPLHCRYESVRDTLLKIGRDANMSEPMVLAFLEKYVRNLQKIQTKKRDQFEQSRVVADNTRVVRPRRIEENPLEEQYQQTIVKAFRETEKEYHTSCNLPGLDSFLNDLSEHAFLSAVHVLHKNLFRSCLGSPATRFTFPTLTKWKMLHQEHITDATVAKKLDDELAQNRVMAITYCSSVIKTGKVFTEPHSVKGLAQRKTIEGCGPHASLLVGSRLHDNRCEYLVKNTWGTHYWGGDAKCYCENTKTKKRWSNCTAKTHPTHTYRVLGCWLPKDKLVPNIYDVTGVR